MTMKLHELQQPKNVNTRGGARDWSRVCKDKQRFFSKRDAVSLIQSDKLTEPETLEPYRCSFCSSWHIGHSRAHYRQLRKLSEQSNVSDNQRKNYLRHIKRLQERNRILAEALADERKKRQEVYAWYAKRLQSWWWRTMDFLLISMADRKE